jgi:uncharacterized membrane protein
MRHFIALILGGLSAFLWTPRDRRQCECPVCESHRERIRRGLPVLVVDVNVPTAPWALDPDAVN